MPFPTLDFEGPPNFGSHLSPDDAHFSPPRHGYVGDHAADRTRSRTRRMNGEHGGRRRKRAWKKLMWVKQSCTCHHRVPPTPDNVAKDKSRSKCCMLTRCTYRPGQLHRPGDLPREPAAQPPSEAIRLLAPRRRLDHHPAARLLRHHIRRQLRVHLSGAYLVRLARQLEQLRHLCRVAALGPVGVRGGRGRRAQLRRRDTRRRPERQLEQTAHQGCERSPPHPST